MTYPVRLSDVLRILISAMAVWVKALASRPMALALKVQVLASRPMALALKVQVLASRPMALALKVQALASRPMALALKVQALALRVEAFASRFRPRLHHWLQVDDFYYYSISTMLWVFHFYTICTNEINWSTNNFVTRYSVFLWNWNFHNDRILTVLCSNITRWQKLCCKNTNQLTSANCALFVPGRVGSLKWRLYRRSRFTGSKKKFI